MAKTKVGSLIELEEHDIVEIIEIFSRALIRLKGTGMPDQDVEVEKKIEELKKVIK